MPHVSAALALALVFAWALPAANAEPMPEPPAAADPTTDYVTAPEDSVDTGSISVGYGFSGRAAGPPARSRSLRFHGDSVEVGLRDGDLGNDAGGDLSSRSNGRELRIGRIAPAWGRGLAVGAPADPWTVRARANENPFAARARAGDGVACAWPRLGVDGFAGRIGGHEAIGFGASRGALRVGSVSARGRPHCVSVALERADHALEIVASSLRRWRAEGVAVRTAGHFDAQLRIAAGEEAFQAPLAPARATPSRAAVISLASGRGALRTTGILAGWRYHAGAVGARAGVESTWRDATRGAWSLGFEEQHGTRRAPTASSHAPGLRQGAWLEWRGESRIAAMSVRSEWWGSRPFVRSRVRESLAVGIEAPLPCALRFTLAHTVYRAHPGETVYVPERDSDRWVLRALGGAGDRTRAMLKLPLAEGTLTGIVSVTRARASARPQWSMQWSRRIRLRTPR